jgi:hypothetical protein
MQIYEKYKIAHADGTPLKGKKYFVLRLDSDDPEEAARVSAAMRTYERKPRNCDVGTAEEQAERFDSFCISHYTPPDKDGVVPDGCDCPCYVRGKGCDVFVWEQLPYVEKEGGAK